MRELTDASNATARIVKTIDEIAFQTNLLALNAAVEAARAGTAGAGFAVVASEVRNLALRAAEAARNTGELINSTVSKIQEGTSIVDGTERAFNAVADSSRRATELVTQIDESSQQQAAGIGQINAALSEMDASTQQNAAEARELTETISIFKTSQTGSSPKGLATPPARPLLSHSRTKSG